jgi:lysophospholipid acyltransferase (LPLAT)-like uncharacterized protein
MVPPFPSHGPELGYTSTNILTAMQIVQGDLAEVGANTFRKGHLWNFHGLRSQAASAWHLAWRSGQFLRSVRQRRSCFWLLICPSSRSRISAIIRAAMSTDAPKSTKPKARRPWHRAAFRNGLAALGPLAIAALMLILRWTCRVRLHNDPRPALRESGEPYIYSVLHAQQLAAATCGDRGTAAMVSHSQDGALVAIGLKCVGITPIRGSSRGRRQDNGGISALNNLIDHVRGGKPAYLAVDGPRGPRNRVHKGIAVLSQQATAVVLNAVVVPSKRWFIKRSWDRIQIPVPFCRIDTYFAIAIRPQVGESIESYRRRIESSLNELETIYDPGEAALAAKSPLNYYRQSPPSSAAA